MSRSTKCKLVITERMRVAKAVFFFFVKFVRLYFLGHCYGMEEVSSTFVGIFQVSDTLVKLEMAHAATTRPEVNARRDTEGKRGGMRRRRAARRGSSDTGENGTNGPSDVELTAARHQSEGNVATTNSDAN